MLRLRCGEIWAGARRAKDLIIKLLVIDPRKRLTAEQAQQHPWLRASAAQAHTDLSGAQDNMKQLRPRMSLDLDGIQPRVLTDVPRAPPRSSLDPQLLQAR